MTTERLQAICIARDGQEGYLCQEIARCFPGCSARKIAPRVVGVYGSTDHLPITHYPLFFSVQFLPAPHQVHAESISLWAKAVFDTIETALADRSQPWCLHVFDPLTADSGESYARPTRIYQAALDLIKDKSRSRYRSRVESASQLCSLIQVVTVTPTSGFISVAYPDEHSSYHKLLSTHPAGYVAIPDDKAPPSRAFKKLREAILSFNLDISPGQTAVDLGASPGGWTHVLRERGALVTAIDRSPLSPALMRDKDVAFIQGNALTWKPTKHVDWLVCDVITTPENTQGIITSWLTHGWCSNFCVTVKFKGAPAFKVLTDISDFLQTHTRWFNGRQLTYNKNEVTIVGGTTELTLLQER